MRVAACLAAAVVLAAACAAAPEASEAVVVRVVMADDWVTAPAVGAVVDAFERDHPGVRVELQGSPFSRIPELVRAGGDLDQPYDLAHWHAFAAANTGLATALDDLWVEAELTDDEYLKGAVQGVSWHGRRYGVPLDVNALVLLVNREVTAGVGIDATELATLSGFRAAAETVVAAGAAEHAIPVTASSWAAYGWIVAHGGEVVEVGGSGRPTFTFDHPDTIAALELLHSLVADDLAPPPLAPDLALDAVQAFARGDVAMHATGSWDLPAARQAVYGQGAPTPEVEVVPLPQADPAAPRTVLGGSSLFIPPAAAQRELAFDLALRLTDDETALRLAAEEGRLPARAHVYDDQLFRSSPQLAAFVEQLPYAEVMPLIAWPDVAEAFREALEAVLAGRASPVDALTDLQRFAEGVAAGGGEMER